jgi:hypothetical protein
LAPQPHHAVLAFKHLGLGHGSSVSPAIEGLTESSVRDVQMRFKLDLCTSDAQYRLASKVGRGRGHRVSGERVFIEWEFAEIGHDSLSSEKPLVNQKLRKKTRSARQIAGQAWLGRFRNVLTENTVCQRMVFLS